MGGLLLLTACLLAKKERKFILRSFGLAVFFLVLSQLLAVLLGLADGRVGEGTWQMYLVVVMLVLYWVFLALLEVGAFRLGSALRTPAEEILTLKNRSSHELRFCLQARGISGGGGDFVVRGAFFGQTL